jgi:hypothetical protein
LELQEYHIIVFVKIFLTFRFILEGPLFSSEIHLIESSDFNEKSQYCAE